MVGDCIFRINQSSIYYYVVPFARSRRYVWRIKHPLCGCFMLVLGTSCLVRREIFSLTMDIGLRTNFNNVKINVHVIIR